MQINLTVSRAVKTSSTWLSISTKHKKVCTLNSNSSLVGNEHSNSPWIWAYKTEEARKKIQSTAEITQWSDDYMRRDLASWLSEPNDRHYFT